MAKGKSAAIDPISRMPTVTAQYAHVDMLASMSDVFAPKVTIGYFEHERPNPCEHPKKAGINAGGPMRYFGGE
jgi:hypothetical protein